MGWHRCDPTGHNCEVAGHVYDSLAAAQAKFAEKDGGLHATRLYGSDPAGEKITVLDTYGNTAYILPFNAIDSWAQAKLCSNASIVNTTIPPSTSSTVAMTTPRPSST